MIRTHKIQTVLQLDVPKGQSRTEFVVLHPRVIEAKWSRNHHLMADELTVSIGWKEGGVDPRTIKNARCAFWMWDANAEDFESDKHLRFAGICTKHSRKLHENGWVVEMTFHDYTTLFLNNKPLKTSGMPEYSDTLGVIWEKICDNTGWQDPANDKIVSSVGALKNNLIFMNPDLRGRTLGELVNKRMHAIAKPTPKHGASSWDVWQYCCAALGLVSYIDGDKCIVTDTTEHFGKANAPRAIYGQNIHSLEETTDATMSNKGVLLKSLDPVTFRVLEAFYPPPGDERIKTRRSAVGKKSEGGAAITENEVSGEYEEFNRFDITDQTALERAAEDTYEQRSRQELEGSFKTAEVFLYSENIEADPQGFDAAATIPIFDLRTGDPIRVELEPGLRDLLEDIGSKATWGDATADQIRYLVDRCDYDEDVAELIVANLKIDEFRSTIFHVKTLEVDLKSESFEVEIKFHNLILTDT